MPFENIPYTNFHDLNLDWIIKEIKNFRDQYEHIQELIDSGNEQLEATSERLLALLNEWYNTHSTDIENELNTAISDFRTQADAYVAQVIASIPAEYSKLALEVQNHTRYINNLLKYFVSDGKVFNMIDSATVHDGGYYDKTGAIVHYANYIYYDKFEIDPNTNYSFLARRTASNYEFFKVYAAALDANNNVTEYINGATIQTKKFPGAKYIAISLNGTSADTISIFAQSSIGNAYVNSKYDLPYKIDLGDVVDLSSNGTPRASWAVNSKLFNHDSIEGINRIGNINGCPENSIEGFKAAYNAGFNSILADLLWTLDGVPVCCHDNDISRVAVTNSGDPVTGVRISNTNYQDLLQYDFGLRFGEQYKGTRILTLRQLLTFVKGVGLKLWLEFKNFDSPAYSIRDTVELVHEFALSERVVWAGGVGVIRTVHNAYPKVPIAFIAPEGEIPQSTFNEVMYYKNDNDMCIFGWTTTTLTQDQINTMIGNGSTFAVGTIDTEADIRQFLFEHPFCSGIESNSVVASVAAMKNYFPF